MKFEELRVIIEQNVGCQSLCGECEYCEEREVVLKALDKFETTHKKLCAPFINTTFNYSSDRVACEKKYKTYTDPKLEKEEKK